MHRWLIGWLLLASACACRAGYAEIPALEPTTYASPDGGFTVTIDPSRRDGGGEAHYVMRRGGGVVWEATHPFTLRKAVVADDGTVGGFGYSNGYEAFDDAGDLLIATIDPAGKPLHVDRIARAQSRKLHGYPEPVASGVLLQPAQRRFVIRMAEDPGEQWLTYSLADGIRSGSVDVEGPTVAARHVEAARQLVGVPLTVVQWFRAGEGSGQACPHAPVSGRVLQTGDEGGTTFALLDADAVPVWTLHWPRGEDRDAHAIADVDAKGRFALRDAQTQIDYAVEADATGGWIVRETGRSVVPPVAKHSIEQIPAVRAKPLGTIRLRAAEAKSTIAGVVDFAFDAHGRVGVLARTQGTMELVVFEDGRTETARVALPDLRTDSPALLAWRGGTHWLAVQAWSGVRAPAFDVDVAMGTATPVAFDADTVRALTVTKDGSTVMLAAGDSGERVVAFDREGRKRWTIEAGGADAQLLSPEDVSAYEDGIVVLENVTNRLKVYGPDGRHRRTIELARTWGRAPQYATAVVADGDGFLVHDVDASPSLVWTEADGTIADGMKPSRTDGSTLVPAGKPRIDRDGEVWVSDGDALYRLQYDGDVDHVLGEEPTADMLGDAAAMFVGPHALYVVDRRTGAVHVFDRSGRPRRICRPAPYDHATEVFDPSVAVFDDGTVFVGRDDDDGVSFVHYAADCTRIGRASIDIGGEVSQKWYPQPRTGARWVVGYRDAYLVDRDGKVERRIERSADRRWLHVPGTASVAADGSIAILSDGWGDPRISTFAADGTPLATWAVPRQVLGMDGRLAYDGRRVAVMVSSEAGRRSHLLVSDAQGGRGVRIGMDDPDSALTVHLVDGELWTFDRRRTITRYAVPALGR